MPTEALCGCAKNAAATLNNATRKKMAFIWWLVLSTSVGGSLPAVSDPGPAMTGKRKGRRRGRGRGIVSNIDNN